MHLGPDGWGVDVRDARLEIADGGEGAVDVTGVERRREAVVDGVGDLDGLLEGVELEEADHRSEDLFAGDAHLGGYAGEDRRGEERALAKIAFGEGMAAGEELRSLVPRDAPVTL